MTASTTDQRIVEVLNQVEARLERLTRDCFAIVRAYWVDGKRNSDAYQNMEHRTSDAIAECLSEVMMMVCPESDGHVFVAPRYRGTGVFKDEPGTGQVRDSRANGGETEGEPENDKSLRKKECQNITWRFGSFARNSQLVPKDQLPFMPVAYWDSCIYEKKIVLASAILAEPVEIQISGFSGWSAVQGFLGHTGDYENKPIFGFHFALTDQPKANAHVQNGLLQFGFPRDTSPFGFNKAFLGALSNQDCYFYNPEIDKTVPRMRNKADSDNCEFPVIKGLEKLPEADRALAREIAEAIFSTLFFSNFNLLEFPKQHSIGWDGLEIGIGGGDNGPPHSSMNAAAAYFFSRYRTLADSAGKGSLLTFHNYYAFLLNPSLNFRDSGSKEASAIGTVNLYTDDVIPPILTGLIRKHLESIYHFLRELEEWEDATREGKKVGAEVAYVAVDDVLGHEVGKVYDTAYQLMQAAPDDTVVQQIVASTLQYGMLWANYANASIPTDAQLWSDGGISVKHSTYVACLGRDSWRLFLVSEVLRGISLDDLRKSIDAIKSILNPGHTFERPDDLIYFELESAFKNEIAINGETRIHRKQLSRAVYRWAMAVASNLWKHLTLQSANDLKSYNLMSVAQRIDCVKNTLANLDTAHQIPKCLPSIRFVNTGQGCTITIGHPCEDPQSRRLQLRGTFLVMVLAGQEIWKAQKQDASFENVQAHTHFGYDAGEHCWISSLFVPRLLAKSLESVQ
ncbi:MAG: hypothetical protein NT159_19385 [Proteobacteria bacterium]|nr:hypothetical protein [Pseudomonadota bacterium]